MNLTNKKWTHFGIKLVKTFPLCLSERFGTFVCTMYMNIQDLMKFIIFSRKFLLSIFICFNKIKENLYFVRIIECRYIIILYNVNMGIPKSTFYWLTEQNLRSHFLGIGPIYKENFLFKLLFWFLAWNNKKL